MYVCVSVCVCIYKYIYIYSFCPGLNFRKFALYPIP